MEAQSVLCEVRTKILNILYTTQIIFSLQSAQFTVNMTSDYPTFHKSQ
jgi:hypothetical protein